MSRCHFVTVTFCALYVIGGTEVSLFEAEGARLLSAHAKLEYDYKYYYILFCSYLIILYLCIVIRTSYYYSCSNY